MKFIVTFLVAMNMFLSFSIASDNLELIDDSMRLSYTCMDLEYDCGWDILTYVGLDGDEVTRFSMRFSTDSFSICTLKLIEICFHGNYAVGNPGCSLFVWADDGSGYPGELLDIYSINPVVNWLPAYESAWLSSSGPIFQNGEDFHIGYAILQNVPADILPIAVDDGSCGTSRSNIFKNGSWVSFADEYGTDRNFLIRAEVCGETAILPHIVSTFPAQNEIIVSSAADIMVTFNTALDNTTINSSSIVIHTNERGSLAANYSYDPVPSIVTIDPVDNFRAGEIVTVSVNTNIQSVAGDPLTQSYVWQFTIASSESDVTFATPEVYSVSSMYDVEVGDLNGDNMVDIIISSYYDDYLLINDGFGIFTSEIHSWPVDNNLRYLEFIDAENDGDLDVAGYDSWDGDSLYVYSNNGSAIMSYHQSAAGGGNFGRSNDLNGDGYVDLVYRIGYDRIEIMINAGDGTFLPPDTFLSSYGQTNYSMACDIDNDYDLDILCNNVTFDNNGQGSFTYNEMYTPVLMACLIDIADINSDGNIDVLVSYADAIWPYLNVGNGAFEAQDFIIGGAGPITCGDFDGDHAIDIATVTNTLKYLVMYYNTGEGEFSVDTISQFGISISYIYCTDVDNDGDLDLLLYGNNKIYVMRNIICKDTDGDSFGDSGYPDNECAEDNCSYVFNPLQEDYDEDMIGDSCDPCNNFHPSLFDAGDTLLIAFDEYFAFYPVVSDPDDENHTITYIVYPHWCTVQNDSLVGEVPDTVFAEPLIVVVEDACNVDTLSTLVMIYICGNSNGDLSVNVGDAVFIINYVFKGGDAPVPIESGDANGDGDVNVADAVYLINYVFKGGPGPVCP